MDNTEDWASPGHLKQVSLVTPAPSRIPLRADLWFDSGDSILLHSGERILLTAREAAVLTLLLQAPRRWQSARELAHRLKRRWPHINAHSVEQTICNLRQKLGESGKRPGILLSRYGLGYSLVLAALSDSST